MIYTKTGDGGTTSLVGGSRVEKCDVRVEAYGTVDELNSHIGVMGELVKPISEVHYAQLKEIQNDLFVIQTLLATEDASIYAKLPQLSEEAPAKLEGWIDAIQAQLPKNDSFIIAGGNMAGAQCHVARCVCRRAERRIVELCHSCEVSAHLKKYINRLSDYLFVLSRLMVVVDGCQENFWHA